MLIDYSKYFDQEPLCGDTFCIGPWFAGENELAEVVRHIFTKTRDCATLVKKLAQGSYSRFRKRVKSDAVGTGDSEERECVWGVFLFADEFSPGDEARLW
jgi:hypothetical protein